MKLCLIKTKVLAVVIICLGFVAGAVVWLTEYSYDTNIDLISKQSLDTAREVFNNLERNDSQLLSSTLEAVMENDRIRDAFLTGNREKLLEVTSPIFAGLKKNYGITHWYFIKAEPDSRCFLRVHDPKKHDDVINRATYKGSVASKDFGIGKELGKTAFALRVVHPYKDRAGKLIGYMELGEEIDHFFALMKQQTGSDYGLLIKKKFLDEKEWASVCEAKNVPNEWAEHQDVLLVNRTTGDKNLISFQGDIEAVPDEGKVLEQFNKGDHAYVRSIIPLYDAAQRKVGGVFVLNDITAVYAGMKAVQTKALVTIITLMAVLSVIMVILLNRLVFARLSRVTNVATRVVGGDFDTQIVPASQDEVGQLESLLEQFRVVFVNTLKAATMRPV